MQVKKFRARNIPEAMALVRADLGYDAVILHSDKVRQKGLRGLLGQSAFEVVAAVDTDLRDFPKPTPAANDAIKNMQQELAALKSALAEASQIGWSSTPARIASLDHWYHQLRQRGVAAPLAQKIVQAVSEELSRWALENNTILNEHFRWHLKRRLPAANPLVLTSGRPQVHVVVGPTGVGKTTTIAKLAAVYAYSQAARVLIITTDTFRVAALPQMQAYGDLLGIPVEVAYNPGQLASLTRTNQDYDLILVDTPGRSQNATRQVGELCDFICALPEKNVSLALTAGSRYEDMQAALAAFSPMSLDSLIFTKIDETRSMGAAYSLACEAGLQLNCLTNGQRVPEDIEVATADKLVDLMVGSIS